MKVTNYFVSTGSFAKTFEWAKRKQDGTGRRFNPARSGLRARYFLESSLRDLLPRSRSFFLVTWSLGSLDNQKQKHK